MGQIEFFEPPGYRGSLPSPRREGSSMHRVATVEQHGAQTPGFEDLFSGLTRTAQATHVEQNIDCAINLL